MNMYVGNLSYNVKEVDLREVMEEYGTVGSVKLIIDRDTRRSKGFAFVEMPETSEASNAIKQLNGVEYALIFVIMIFILQQFDGLILGPRLLGQSTGLSPIWVIFGITVGGA